MVCFVTGDAGHVQGETEVFRYGQLLCVSQNDCNMGSESI